MTELKNKLLSDENKQENLVEVAKELSAFYKTIEKSEPKITFSKKILDELYLIANDHTHTSYTRMLNQDKVKEKLLAAITGEIENSNNHAKRNVLKRVRENSLEVIVHFFKIIVLRVKGIGEKGMRKVLWITVFIICMIGFFYWLGARDPKPELSVNYTEKTVDTLYNGYTNKKHFYERRQEILKNTIKDEPNIERRRALLLELRTVESKLDSLNGAILPHLARIRKNEIDSASRSSIDSYKQNFQNF